MIHSTLTIAYLLFTAPYNLNPPEIQILIQSGLEYAYIEKFDSAQTYFDKIIESYPENPAGYFFKAALLQLKMMDQCHYAEEKEYLSLMKQIITYTEKILEEEKNVWAEFYLGSSYINSAFHEGSKNNYFEAFKYSVKGGKILHGIIKNNPTFFDAYFGAGASEYFWARATRYLPILKLADGKIDEAIRKLHIAAQKSLYSGQMSRNALAYIYGEENDFSNADAIIDSLLLDYPKSRIFLWNKANLEFKKKNFLHAAELYNNIFSMYYSHNNKNFANLAQCKLFIGKCFYELEEKDEAKKALKEVIGFKKYANKYPKIKDYCREAYALLSRIL